MYFTNRPIIFISLITIVMSPMALANKAEDMMSIIDLSKPAYFTQQDIQWSPATTLPPGASIAVLEGDPLQAGPYTLQLRLPENYKIPAHWLPMDEHITVLQGSLYVRMGNLDIEKPKEKGKEKEKAKEREKILTLGSFSRIPTKMEHSLWTTEETVIQLHGLGPWNISYVNPQDDPNKTAVPNPASQELETAPLSELH